MKTYNKCAFCEAEGPDVKLVPFRSVVTSMCENCMREYYDKVHGVGSFDTLGKKPVKIDMTMISFPPPIPSAIARPVNPAAVIEGRVIAGAIGSPETSSLIEAHMEEYFQRWPNYKNRLTVLEWYHLFLDFFETIETRKVAKKP